MVGVLANPVPIAFLDLPRRLRSLIILNDKAATIKTAIPTPTPLSTLAPVDISTIRTGASEGADVGCDAALLVVAVVEKLRVEELEPAEEVEEEGVEEVEEVDLLGESVDPICPVPSITIPLSPAQQAGSLSQQKLPSLHVATRGRRPLGDAGPEEVSSLLAPTDMSRYHRDKEGNNPRQSMGTPDTPALSRCHSFRRIGWGYTQKGFRNRCKSHHTRSC